MVRYNGQLLVPHARARVWALLSDWTNLATWDMNITRCDLRPGSTPTGVGAKFDCTFSFNGRVTDAGYECVEWDEGKRAVFEATSNLVRSRDTIEIDDGPDGQTEVKAEFHLFLRGPLFPLSFLLNGAMQDTCPKVMKDMRSFLDERLAK